MGFVGINPGLNPSIAVAAGSVAQWCAFMAVTFTTNIPVATNSFSVGNVSGITITPPAGGTKFSGAFVG
jgi:hypothetical protein